MNPVRPLSKLADCASGANVALPPAASTSTASTSTVRQRYCVSALCSFDHGEDVERRMRHELRTPGLLVEQIRLERQANRHLVRVVAVVSCAARARSVLFRLLNRLGLDAGVRSICWETASSAPRHAPDYRCAAPASHPLLATVRAADRVASASR